VAEGLKEALADATGKIEGEDTIGLQSISVKEGYKRQDNRKPTRRLLQSQRLQTSADNVPSQENRPS